MSILLSEQEIWLKLGSILFTGFPTDPQVKQAIEYLKTEVLPQKIKEAERKLIGEIERDGKCGNGDIDYPLVEWNKLKKSRGIE